MQKGNGIYAGGLSRFQGGAIGSFGLPPAMAISTNSLMARYQGEAVYSGETSQIATAAIPNGYEPPYSWHMAIKGGGMSAYTTVNGSGGVSEANLLLGKDLSASLIGDGTISEAAMGLIVSLVATLAGTSSISAELKGALNLAADLAGEGDAAAALGALALLTAAVTGSGDIDAILSGLLSMSSDITVTGTGLSTANVGPAVWAALASANNTAGTMGEKLNDAGSAGNPWAALLASNVDPDTFGWLINEYIDAKLSEIKQNTNLIPPLL